MMKIPKGLLRDQLIDALRDLVINDGEFGWFTTQEIWNGLQEDQQKQVASYLDY